MNKVDYSVCFLSKSHGTCGIHKKSRPSGLFKFSELSDEIEKGITEGELISSRLHQHLSDDNILCAFHRQKFGRYWKTPNRCLHPEHSYPKALSKMKVKDLRKATIPQFEFINKKFPNTFPLYGNLCRQHRNTQEIVKSHEELDTEHKENENDELYIPEEPNFRSSFTVDDVNEFVP